MFCACVRKYHVFCTSKNCISSVGFTNFLLRVNEAKLVDNEIICLPLNPMLPHHMHEGNLEYKG